MPRVSDFRVTMAHLFIDYRVKTTYKIFNTCMLMSLFFFTQYFNLYKCMFLILGQATQCKENIICLVFVVQKMFDNISLIIEDVILQTCTGCQILVEQ